MYLLPGIGKISCTSAPFPTFLCSIRLDTFHEASYFLLTVLGPTIFCYSPALYDVNPMSIFQVTWY